jgi:RNA polymerase sigma-70 factor (ECF subfamily)
MAADPEIAALVGRAQAGDRDAFGALYERLAPKIYSYLYFQLQGRAEVAEDLAEEVFLKVLEKLDRYEDRGLPFSAWVFRIAHNHLIDHVRARPKQASVPIEECQALAETEAERALDRALIRGELSGALEQLTEDQRRVVALRFLQGTNIPQTARAMGKTEDAVKKLQGRGLRTLRRALGPATLAELAA